MLMRCSSTPLSGAFPVRSPLAQGGPIDHRTASPHCRQAVSNDQPHIVVWVEFQIFCRQAHGTKRRKNPRHAAWQGDILIWKPQAHGVAYAEFGTEASWGTNFLHRFNEPLHELHGGAGGVFEMEARTNARVYGDTYGVKIGLRRLPASTRMAWASADPLARLAIDSRATEPIDGRASPRKPRVAMRSRS